MTQKDFIFIFQAYSVNMRGVAGPHPFFGRKLKLGIFSKLFLRRVAYDLEAIKIF